MASGCGTVVALVLEREEEERRKEKQNKVGQNDALPSCSTTMLHASCSIKLQSPSLAHQRKTRMIMLEKRCPANSMPSEQKGTTLAS